MFKSCSAKGSVASEFPGHWRGCVSPNIAWICLKTPPNNNTTISNLVGGIPTPLNSSQDMETHKIHVPKHQPAIDSPSTGFPTGTINHQKISSTQHLQASCPPSRHRLGPPEIHSQLPQHIIISPSKQKDTNKHPWTWEFFTSCVLHLPIELSPFIILGGS